VLKQPALQPSPPIPPTAVPPLQELSSTSPAVPPAEAFNPSPPPPAYALQDPDIIDLSQPTADLDPAAIQEEHSHAFEPGALQHASSTLLNSAPSFPMPQPQPLMSHWDAVWLPRADVVGIPAKRRKIAATQAGRADEVNEYPLRCGRQIVEYETGTPMTNGAVAPAQTQHLSHLAPKTNPHSAARPAQFLAAIQNTVSPRRHVDANWMDTGSDSSAYADSTPWQTFNPGTTQIPAQDSLGYISAPDALEQGVQGLGMMPQPILHETTRVPRPVGNDAGTSPDAYVGATTAGEFDHESDYQWSGTFIWERTNMALQVFMKEPLGDACAHFIAELLSIQDLRPYRLAPTWPSVLSLNTTPYTLSTLELQRWMKENGAVIVRFGPASESDGHNFAHLAKYLRERKRVSLPCSHQAVL
jgi:hypothetical protein